jgi:hypothetical protein
MLVIILYLLLFLIANLHIADIGVTAAETVALKIVKGDTSCARKNKIS